MTGNMEIPSRYGGGLPAIYIEGGNPSRGFGTSVRSNGFSSRFSPTLSTIPMSIPGASSHEDPPPPLPPPKFVPVDGPVATTELRDHYRRDLSGSIGASKYGSLSASLSEERPNYKSREGEGVGMHIDRDEGYASMSSTRSRESIPTSFGMTHERFHFRANRESFDNSMLDKLNTRRTLENKSPPRRSGLGLSAAESAPVRMSDRFPMALQPLSLPTRIKQQPIIDSPNRYTETPLHSALSPRSMPFSHQVEYRSPPNNELGDLERSPIPRSRRTNSGSLPDDVTVSTQSSVYELNGEDVDFPMEETTRLRGFHIEERADYRTVGQKRRASSPPGDDPPPPLGSELLRRRDIGASRGSPTPRLAVIPQGSVSSISSAGRSGSYTSMSLTTSSLTSMGSSSFGRRSPGGLSPGGMSPIEATSCGSPYATPVSLTTSPRSSLSRAVASQQAQQQQQQQQQQHQRVMSDHQQLGPGMPPSSRPPPMPSPRKLTEMPKPLGKMHGFFMCECCPKKPKKFDTVEELNAHEAEKQYECCFCGNRFKNKNEAERHQNSLHVRRHSWSCSALTGYEKAFHDSTSKPGECDTCGYCGDEFRRTGPAAGAGAPGVRYISEQDWDERIRHLQDTHKFRECNSSKKFYRADHFRQHLKHSHAGTSGKWTNMLENACMMEEDPPMMK